MVCSDRNRCGCYLRPDAPGQIYEPHYKAGDRCQHYESVPEQYHIVDFDEKRIDVIGANGNDGLHYEAI